MPPRPSPCRAYPSSCVVVYHRLATPSVVFDAFYLALGRRGGEPSLRSRSRTFCGEMNMAAHRRISFPCWAFAALAVALGVPSGCGSSGGSTFTAHGNGSSGAGNLTNLGNLDDSADGGDGGPPP